MHVFSYICYIKYNRHFIYYILTTANLNPYGYDSSQLLCLLNFSKNAEATLYSHDNISYFIYNKLYSHRGNFGIKPMLLWLSVKIT